MTAIFSAAKRAFLPALLKWRALGSHFGGAGAKRLRGLLAAGESRFLPSPSLCDTSP